MSRPLGWKVDPQDDRDHDALKAGYLAPVVVPPSNDNADLLKIVDQGQLGSCTANSTGQAVRAAQLLEMVERAAADWVTAGFPASTFDVVKALTDAQAKLEFWARLFPYYLARGYDHTTRDDAGTNIRTIFQAINKFGFCPESVWPYNDNTDPKAGPVTFDKMPPAEAFREAYDQRDSAENVGAKVIDYARITAVGQARIDAIKLASSQRHLVAFGTTVTEKFCEDMSANGGKPIDPPALSDKIAGGHALAIAGYSASGAKIANSWSTQFGEDGCCWFSWDYIVWAETTDLWIVRRAPILAKAGA